MSNNVGTGSVDPELLAIRLSAMENAEEREQATSIVNAAFACLARIGAIDFRSWERERTAGAARTLWTAAESSIAAVWGAIEELRHAAKTLVDEHQDRFGGDDGKESRDSDDSFGEGLFGESEEQASPKKVAPTTPIQRIGETVWATSFVLNSEVDSFRKRLPALINVPDAWELLGDLQDHAAHIKAALQAILTGVYASMYPGGPGMPQVTSHDEDSIELVAARELRQRIFALRDEVVGIETSMLERPAGEWQPLLRKIVEALGVFMFGPGFAWMRAGDKRTFITQQRALRDILEMWSPLRATPAKRAVQNLARYLEALETINQRECLVVHDRAALTSVVQNLASAQASPGPESRQYIGAALAALAEAQGRDRVLDAMLEQTLAPGSVVPTLLILERAQELLARL